MKIKLGKIFKDHKEIIIALIVGISLIGYALITRQTKLDTLNKEINQEIVNKIEEQDKEDEANKVKALQLSFCLSKAENDFWETWKLNCSSNIVKDKDGVIPDYLKKDVDFNLFWDVWNIVKQESYDKNIPDTQLFYGALSGIVTSLADPHSVFFTPENTDGFNEELDSCLGS